MKHISAKAHQILNDPELLRIQQEGYDMLDTLLDGREAESPFLKEYTPSICGYNGRSGFDMSPEKEPLAYTARKAGSSSVWRIWLPTPRSGSASLGSSPSA